MGTTASSLPDPPDPKKEVNNKNEETNDAENVPSVFVNYEFLNFDTSQKNLKVYVIDGETYTDSLEHSREDFEEFKLYAERVESDKEIETPPSKQNFEVQAVDHGFIINSSIFLNIRHYNTIIDVFENCLNCFVCDQIVLEENCGSHVESEDHKRNLKACPLVEKYWLNIFRVINDQWCHCGICNVVFHKDTCSHHIAGKTHVDNEIIASKKAEEIIRNNGSQNTNNDTRNGNNDTQNTNEIDEANNKNDIAFANCVAVKTAKTTFEISYFTWHMILINKDDSFYCMACTVKDSIENLRPHINDVGHKDTLKMFKINDHYENHLIRQNEKWCHCSTCNGVHYLGDTNLHIIRHDKGNKFAESAKTIQISEDKSNDNNDKNDLPKNENNDSPSTSSPQIDENIYNETRIDIAKAIINEKCCIFLFGFNIQVSLLSLNVIFYSDFGFFICELCKVKFLTQTIQDHMKSLEHISRLNSALAIPHYGYNYIRSINNLPHCGICHMLIQPSLLLLHLQDPYHIMKANIALGLVNLPPPPQVPTVTPNVKNVNQDLKKDAQNKINRGNAIHSTNEIENRMNESKNKIDEIKNVIDVTKNISNETKNRINESPKIKKSDVYIEVIENKIHEIELNYGDDYNTGIFDADIEVLTKKARVFVSFTSFNTLVPIGDGERYCFACGVSVPDDMLKNHICSKVHMEMVKDYKFLEEYDYNLIRQNASLYHCAICNTIVRRPELSNHIEWVIHQVQREKNKTNVKKKERNSAEFQNQLFPFDKEVIYSSKTLKEIIIKWSFIIKPSEDTIVSEQNHINGETEEIATNIEINSRNNKTIVIDDLNLKLVLKFDAWHSIIRTKKKYMCVICNEKMSDIDVVVDNHIRSESHMNKLDKPFSTKYFPALIREVNADTIHCATCNIVLYDKKNIQTHIQTHIQGSKHKSHFEDLLNNSTDDSNEDIKYN